MSNLHNFFPSAIQTFPPRSGTVKMISQSDRQKHVVICQDFIQCESVNLTHLIDTLSGIVPDKDSQDWKDWSAHFDKLNEFWAENSNEHGSLPWPEVCP